MSLMIVFAVGALAAGMADPPAQTPSANPSAAGQEDGDRRVCRREVVTGTIMQRSTCHTRREWAEIDEANRESVRRNVDSRGTDGR